MNILVVGGAGYIGSHMVKLLGQRGHEAVVFDNLSTGHRDAIGRAPLIQGDLAETDKLRDVLGERRFDGVLHFASAIVVAESVSEPAKYYRTNVAGTLNLLDACRASGVTNVVLSSSAAVYGAPQTEVLAEDHPLAPINPYGRTKLVCEQMLADYQRAYGLRWVALRYFNAAGADPECEIGERHDPETHLIPLLLQAATGRRKGFTVNGDDFPTPDGTCIRDYVHVMDLADAHVRAVEYLVNGGAPAAMNLGSGRGYSNLEVLDAVGRVTGKPIEYAKGPRREGDPPRLVASRALAARSLGWSPQYSDLDAIVSHAWAWERKLAR